MGISPFWGWLLRQVYSFSAQGALGIRNQQVFHLLLDMLDAEETQAVKKSVSHSCHIPPLFIFLCVQSTVGNWGKSPQTLFLGLIPWGHSNHVLEFPLRCYLLSQPQPKVSQLQGLCFHADTRNTTCLGLKPPLDPK